MGRPLDRLNGIGQWLEQFAQSFAKEPPAVDGLFIVGHHARDLSETICKDRHRCPNDTSANAAGSFGLPMSRWRRVLLWVLSWADSRSPLAAPQKAGR